MSIECASCLTCEECGADISIAGFPERVSCATCGVAYELGPIEDIKEWLYRNWGFIAIGTIGLVALYAVLR